MKGVVGCLFWILVCSASAEAQTNCTAFRTGTFRLVDERIDQEYLIERNETTQIERDLTNNTVSKFKVTWVTDCEYQLEILEGRQELMDFFTGKILSIRILEAAGSGYKFEAQLTGSERKVIHTVERVQ